MPYFFAQSTAFLHEWQKKTFHQTFLYKIRTKFLLYAKKSFEEFAGDFVLFTIHFLTKFDEIVTWAADFLNIPICQSLRPSLCPFFLSYYF